MSQNNPILLDVFLINKTFEIQLNTTQNVIHIQVEEPKDFLLDVINQPNYTVEIRNQIDPNIPLEQGLLIRNVVCDVSVYLGAAVKMNGNSVAELAIATSYAEANVIGIVEEKSSPTICDIRFLGLTGENFTMLNTSEEYYLSDKIAGKIVPFNEAPTEAGHIRIKLGQPFSEKRFVFFKGERIVKG
jgi:hypothetical protein